MQKVRKMTKQKDVPNKQFGSLNSLALSGDQQLLILSLPVMFFAIFGLAVFVLRVFETSTEKFWIAPVISLIVTSISIHSLQKSTPNIQWQKVLTLALMAGTASYIHYNVFPLGAGSDAYLYYNHPLHSFFSSGKLELSFGSYVEYGSQPISYYFIPNSQEYLHVWIAKLFNLSKKHILTISVMISLFLLYFSVFLVASLAKNNSQFMLISSIIFAMPYGLIFLDIMPHGMENAFFRGFDNKGLIFGFLFVNLNLFFFILATKKSNPNLCYIFAISLAILSCFTSQNFVLFVIMASAVLPYFLFQKNHKALIATCLFICICLIYYILLSAMKTVDIYSVISPTETPFPIKKVEDISFNFTSLVFWFFLGCLTLLITRDIQTRKEICYAVYALSIGVASHNVLFAKFYFYLAPEKSILIWRILAALYFWPTVLILFTIIMRQIKFNTILYFASATTLFLTTLSFATQLPEFSKKFPFPKYKEYRSYVQFLKENCHNDSIILASENQSAVLGFETPEFIIFGNKSYFLNLQIANLNEQGFAQKRARFARDAILFLSEPRRKNIPYNISQQTFLNAIDTINPGIIIISEEKLSPKIDDFLTKKYTKSISGDVIYHRDCGVS